MRAARTCLLLGLLSLSVGSLGCNVRTGSDETEDLDGVVIVPSPEGPGVGPGGLGGGGEGGAGGGNNGKPCQAVSDCNDGNPCTHEECVDELCVVTSASDDQNACTTDICDPDTGDISNVPVNVNDDNACTYDSCDVETGAKNLTFLPIFAEDFSDNAAGWVLGPQWQIGPAAPSDGAITGGNDPSADHSSSGDGVAGTEIGGLAGDAAQSFLTSPVIDLTDVTDSDFVTLRFWRWLNTQSEADGFQGFVEVKVNTDPEVVTRLWDTAGLQILDAPPSGVGWFQMRLDLTEAAQQARAEGASMRVLFGFNQISTTQAVGGWNIDDVEIGLSKAPADELLCTEDRCMDVGGVATADHPMIPPVMDEDKTTTFACIEGSGPVQQ